MGPIDRLLGLDQEPLDMERESGKLMHDDAGWERVERYERGEIDRAGREIDDRYDPTDYVDVDEWDDDE